MAKAKNVQIVKQETKTLDVPREDWEIELAGKAKDEQAAEVLGIPRITHRGGILKIDDKKVEGGKLRCAVVGYGLAKLYYETGFDPNAPAATPVCYAFGSSKPGAEAEMKPHPAAPDKQAEACAGCPHNKFGTAEKGKGKRCSDTRKLLVIVNNDDPNAVAKAQVRQISIPPGSLRNWGNYLKSLNDITPYGVNGVLTEIGTENLDSGAYMLTFTAVDRLTKDMTKALFGKFKQIEGELSQPFPVLEAEEQPKPKRKIKGQD